MSLDEIRSLMRRAQRSLRSARNLLDDGDQRNLQTAFRDRSKGDYAGFFPTRERVEQRLAEATAFVDAVTKFLHAQGIDLSDEPSPG